MATVTNITTLNQLVSNLRDIADLHQQIHGFNYGEPWEFYQSGVTNSPEMWVTCEGVDRVGVSVTAFRMRIYIVDNVKRGELNELEVESDLIQIAEDVIAQLRHPSYGWNLTREDTVNVSLRTERTPKMLTAVELAVTVRVKKPENRCAIPFSSPPVFNNGGTSTGCSPVTIFNLQTNQTITTVQAGQTYGVYQFSTIDGGNSITTYTDIIVSQ